MILWHMKVTVFTFAFSIYNIERCKTHEINKISIKINKAQQKRITVKKEYRKQTLWQNSSQPTCLKGELYFSAYVPRAYCNKYLYIDEDMRLRLETKLMKNIVSNFEVRE